MHDPCEEAYDFYITDKWNEKCPFKISGFFLLYFDNGFIGYGSPFH